MERVKVITSVNVYFKNINTLLYSLETVIRYARGNKGY